MASEKDKGSGKDSLSLYDGADELLDYGDDAYDLDADLLGTDLGDVENYGDLDFGAEDDLAFDELGGTSSNATNNKDSKGAEDDNKVKDDGTSLDDNSRDSDKGHSQVTSSLSTVEGGVSGKDKRDESSQHNYQNQSDTSYGNGYNQQLGNGRPPYSNSSMRGGPGRGGMRGRGQGYSGRGMGTGRGNFQGRPGMVQPNLMGMNMGMGMNPMGQNMNMNVMQMMGMGMGMNVGMGMGMNMGGARFPGDGYGNQGMMYPYMGGQGMGGMNARPGMGTPGRTIHINPKFQNRPGMPPIPGLGAPVDQQQQQQQQQQPQQQSQYSQQQRPQSQDSGRGQARGWENKLAAESGQITRSGGRDEYDSDRNDTSQRFSGRDDGKSNTERYNGAGSRSGTGTGSGSGTGASHSHGERLSGDSLRPKSDRDGGLSTRRISDRLSGDTGRSLQYDSSIASGGGITSISSRLTPGLKRSGENLEDSNKALKSSGGSTPRNEQMRSSDKDSGSVSFLRDKRESSEPSKELGRGGLKVEAKGFVKMENVPESLSDDSIRKLASGVSGVDRILTIAKKSDRTITLGFASVDEAKFFRRQINRTTIEGSLVTVTLTSS